ncbi:hypothetical protein FBEOM_627 [Fusarium beomiforme]|uniref:Uncharacterized protein n=1 Tax=Fusarium beomiforme TaxID=44412 RepID=A0A9P5E1R4_9HYPO|nr:hypothetical protein FBEOM_627 [Fusarium beomiforme]
MSNPSYGDLPLRDPYAYNYSFIDEKPSPLRIVKCNRNVTKRRIAGHPKHDSSKHRQSFQGDGSLAVAKRREINPEKGATDKENTRFPQQDQGLIAQGRQTLREAKCWVQQDDSPPQRFGVTPSPQLSVKRTRQTRPKDSLGPGHPASYSTPSTLPAAYDLRRPVKARPPLTNLYDRAPRVNAESPPVTYATGREEGSPPFSRNPSTALSERPNTLQRSRPEHWPTPHVSITPEVMAIERGRHVFWVAIEISTKPWPDLFMDLAGSNQRDQEMEGSRENDGLYDLSVQIKPTEESSVIRVLQEQAFPIHQLDLGSSIFLLAQVQSDNLIEALKEELGDSTVSYMTVQLSYRNSAIAMCQDMEIVEDEMFSIHSKIETVATASVKLYNAMSLWSPPPVLRSNALLPLVERHWGTINARKVMAQIAATDYDPKDPEHTCCWPQKPIKDLGSWTHIKPPSKYSPTPMIPLRKTSLQRGFTEADLDDTEIYSEVHQRDIFWQI